MDINFEKGTVTLFGKTGKLDTLIKKFTMLSGEQVYHFLINRGIQLSRKMNCYALMSVLNQRIKFLNTNSLSKDYFERLQYYSAFGEHQLYNLFLKICNDNECFYAYRYNLFKLILSNFVALDFSDGELSYVKNLKKASIESFEQYFNYISGASLEQDGTFDGQDSDILFSNLSKSASTQEIYDIAGKYGIELPQSLNKEDYYNYIIWDLEQTGKYNDELAEGLKEKEIEELDTYCDRTEIPMSSNLEKGELVNYFIYLLSKTSMDTTSIKRFDITEEYIPLEFSVDLEVLDKATEDSPKKVIHYNGEEEDKDEFNQLLIIASQPQEEEIKEIDEVLDAPVEETKEETADEEIDSILDAVVAGEFVEAVYEVGNEAKKDEDLAASAEAPVEEASEAPQEEAQGENPESQEENPESQEENPVSTEEEALDEGAPQIEEVAEDATVMLNEDLSDVEAASDEEIASLMAQENASSKEEEKEEPKKDESFKTGVAKNEDYGSEKLLKLGTKSTAKTVVVSVILALLVGILIYILIALLV